MTRIISEHSSCVSETLTTQGILIRGVAQFEPHISLTKRGYLFALTK